MNFVKKYFQNVAKIASLIDINEVNTLAKELAKVKKRNGRVFFLGVGGSAGNSSHAVNDFRKLCNIEAYTPTDNVSELTARINDEGWNSSFANWLKVSNLNKNDALFIFSVGGGNKKKKVSVNLIMAIDYAKKKGSKIMGEKSSSEVLDIRVKDNEKIKIENIELISMHTPGHTDCSYSFLMNDRVFTGDALLINGTGRTDFQNGNSHDAYDSLFNKLLKLPDKTLVYPAHDYNGKKNSSIENEKKTNPRLQVKSAEEFAEMMNNLNLTIPKMINIAVPANIKGFTLDQVN